MAERTLETLVLKDEDYIFAGDLTIEGDVIIKNGALIVSGTLTITSDYQISIIGGDLSVGELNCGDINVIDADIYVAGDFDCCKVTSNSKILVHGNADTTDISCCSYLVDGNNSSYGIKAIKEIHIEGDNDSHSLNAYEIFIGGDADLNDGYLVALYSLRVEGELTNCSSVVVHDLPIDTTEE